MYYTQPKLSIQLSHIQWNYQFLSQQLAPSRCAAVLKCHAYGLGESGIAPALEKIGCSLFFVADTAEALRLKKYGVQAEIAILSGPEDRSADFYRDSHFIPVANTIDQAYWCMRHAVPWILQVDTGMNRLGVRYAELAWLPKKHLPTHLRMVLSHLACSHDTQHPFNQQQLSNLQHILQLFPGKPVSLAASSAYHLPAAYQFDWVRVGSGLFGFNTCPNTINPLKKVVFLEAPVIQKSVLHSGEYLGYGIDYQAQHDIKIALLRIGYGDGLLREWAKAGQAWFKNPKDGTYYRAPFLGRFSMDYIACDVSHIPEQWVQLGQMASLLTDHYGLDEMAQACGIAGCAEVLTRLGQGQRFIRQLIF